MNQQYTGSIIFYNMFILAEIKYGTNNQVYCGIIFICSGQCSWVAEIFQVWRRNFVGSKFGIILINIQQMFADMFMGM